MIVRLTFEIEVDDNAMREYIANQEDTFEEPPTAADVLIREAGDVWYGGSGRSSLIVSMVAHGVDDPAGGGDT